MKKIYAVIAAILVSCTLFGQSQQQVNASKLIEFTNSVIDLSNEFNYKYKSYQTFIKNAEKAYERYSEKYTPGENIYVHGYEGLEPRYNFYNKYEQALTAVPDAVEGKAEVYEAMNEAREITASLNETAKAMKEYMESAGFSEDKFARYHTLMDELVKGYDDMEKAWSQAVATASAEGQKAENILIQDSPAAPFILAMKGDIDLVSKIIDDLYEMFEEDEEDYTLLVERANSLKETLEQHKAMAEGISTSQIKGIGRFRGFYQHMLSAHKSLEYVLRELTSDNPSYNNVNAQANSMNSYFNAAINSYNDF